VGLLRVEAKAFRHGSEKGFMRKRRALYSGNAEGLGSFCEELIERDLRST
jgi:hypothetical protein